MDCFFHDNALPYTVSLSLVYGLINVLSGSYTLIVCVLCVCELNILRESRRYETSPGLCSTISGVKIWIQVCWKMQD